MEFLVDHAKYINRFGGHRGNMLHDFFLNQCLGLDLITRLTSIQVRISVQEENLHNAAVDFLLHELLWREVDGRGDSFHQSLPGKGL